MGPCWAYRFLAQLYAAVSRPQIQVVLVAGRGGIGKSKLSHAFSNEFRQHQPDTQLWFVQKGIPIGSDSLQHLPTAPSVFVLDDAHHYDDLGSVLSLLRTHYRQAAGCMVLVTRPHALEQMRSTLTRIGLDSTQIAELKTLTQLDHNDIRLLARQVLGEPREHLTELLVSVSKDSPLVTVVGGRPVAEKQLPVQLLERDADFRFAVLSRFYEVTIGKVHDRIDRPFASACYR